MLTDGSDHFWVFGYGSLMWNPGFDYLESHHARVTGLHRSPCIYSWEHRGTRERPGIVLGLDRGGSCLGIGYKVAAVNFEPVMAYLRARELVTNVYLETTRSMVLSDTRETAKAVTYIADRKHQQYAGRLEHDQLVAQIKGARGNSGPNEEYFLDTARKLADMGIRDAVMENLALELSGF